MNLKKIPWWAWLLLPVALLILVVRFFRGGGPGWLRLPSGQRSPGAAAPALTPEQAEERQEEITERLEEQKEAIADKYEEREQKARKRWEDL